MMALNPYFSQGTNNENTLYEDLIIESIKQHGIEVYYLPRTIVNFNSILNEDELSKFGESFKVEMYLGNVDGFEGDGDLLSKFGVEIRDQITLIVSQRRFKEMVGRFQPEEGDEQVFPQQGDLIYIPMIAGLFSINFSNPENPFFQLKGLKTYTMTCELYDYSNDEIDTGIDEIDEFEDFYAQKTTIGISNVDGTIEQGETIYQYKVGVESMFTNEDGDYSYIDSSTWTNQVDGDSYTHQGDYLWENTSKGLSSIEPRMYPFLSTFFDSSEDLAEINFTHEIVYIEAEVHEVGVDELLVHNIQSSIGENNAFVEGFKIFGDESFAKFDLVSIDSFDDIDKTNKYADNKDFEDFGNAFIDFSIDNPFGEVNNIQ